MCTPALARSHVCAPACLRRVQTYEAVSQAKAELAGDTVHDKFAALEKDDAIEKLLAEIKSRRSAGTDPAAGYRAVVR